LDSSRAGAGEEWWRFFDDFERDLLPAEVLLLPLDEEELLLLLLLLL